MKRYLLICINIIAGLFSLFAIAPLLAWAGWSIELPQYIEDEYLAFYVAMYIILLIVGIVNLINRKKAMKLLGLLYLLLWVGNVLYLLYSLN